MTDNMGRPLTMRDPNFKDSFTQQLHYDFNDSYTDVSRLIKKYSKNFHRGYLNMNIKIDL